MQNLIKLLVVVAFLGGVTAYFMGWFDFNVGVNAKKIKEDLKGTAADGLVAGLGEEGNAKDAKGSAPGKEADAGKDGSATSAKNDGGKKDTAVAPGNAVAPLKEERKEERAEGIVYNIAKGMPRFSIHLIDSNTKKLDSRVMTFDLAPQSEIRVNDILSDFRAIQNYSKVVVTFYREADPTNMTPSKNMARLIVIERASK